VPTTTQTAESDFSARKLTAALAIIVGVFFGSTVLPFTAQALLLVPMTEELHWSRTQFSLGLSAMMLGGMCSAPLLGRLVDRIGVRLVVIGGTVLVGLMMLLLSRQSGALSLYLGGFFILGGLGSSAVGYAKVLGSLFNANRGKAMALFGMESSMATALAVPIIRWLLNGYGWRGTFVGMGLIILATVPVGLLLLPEPLRPPGAPAQSSSAPLPATAAVPGLTVSQALRDRLFWMVTGATFLAIIPAMGLAQHMVPYMMGQGVTLDRAAGIFTIMMAAMAVGTLAGGFLLDSSSSGRIATPFAVLSTLSLIGMLYLSGTRQGLLILTVSTAAMGFAAGAKIPMANFFQLRYFGLREFGSIAGAQAPFIASGMLIAPPAMGFCYDRLGTYVPALWVMVVLMGLTALIYASLRPYRYTRDLQEIPSSGVPGDR
jgi:MFS family permease